MVYNYITFYKKGKMFRRSKLPKFQPREPFKVFIYLLFDIIKKCPIYVGASKDPKVRLYGHRSTTIKNYINKDHVSIQILEETNSQFAADKEKEWYYKIKSLGHELLQTDKKWYANGMAMRQTDDRSYQRRVIIM